LSSNFVYLFQHVLCIICYLRIGDITSGHSFMTSLLTSCRSVLKIYRKYFEITVHVRQRLGCDGLNWHFKCCLGEYNVLGVDLYQL